MEIARAAQACADYQPKLDFQDKDAVDSDESPKTCICIRAGVNLGDGEAGVRFRFYMLLRQFQLPSMLLPRRHCIYIYIYGLMYIVR